MPTSRSPEPSVRPGREGEALLHPFSDLRAADQGRPFIVASAEGAEIRDDAGRRYLDGCAGLWCVNAGHGRREILEAMRAQAADLAYFHAFDDFANRPALDLAETLLEIAPPGMARVLFGCTGSDANEANLKMVWRYWKLLGRPEKKTVFALDRAYHGVTVAAAGLSGLPALHTAFDLPRERFRHVAAPMTAQAVAAGEDEEDYATRLATELDQAISAEGSHTVAAFFVEPAVGAGGVLAPPRGYFEKIAAVLQRHEVLLVVDEVVCGFGRLGSWFGCDRYGLAPDLMTLGKGLTSGYQPLSASIVSERVWDVLRRGDRDGAPFPHGVTFSAHPIAAAAALANIKVLGSEPLIGAGERLEQVLATQAQAALAAHPLVAQLRTAGAMLAVELPPAAEGDAFPSPPRRLRDLARERGLLVRPLSDGRSVALCPPLVFSDSQAAEAMAILRDGLDVMQSQAPNPSEPAR